MKTLPVFSAMLFSLVLLFLPAAPAVDTYVPPADRATDMLDDGTLVNRYDEAVAPVGFWSTETGRTVTWVIGIAIAAMLIGWGWRASTRVDGPPVRTERSNPDLPTDAPSRSI